VKGMSIAELDSIAAWDLVQCRRRLDNTFTVSPSALEEKSKNLRGLMMNAEFENPSPSVL
jgi:hypothetical protein